MPAGDFEKSAGPFGKQSSAWLPWEIPVSQCLSLIAGLKHGDRENSSSSWLTNLFFLNKKKECNMVTYCSGARLLATGV